MNPIRANLRFRRLLLAAAAGFLVPGAGAAIVSFTESTNPPGIFSSSTNVETGTTVSTRTATLVSGANTFTHWTLNGVRKSDASGRSLNPVSFTILEPTATVANYLPTTQDSDADGLPDCYEIEFFASLAQTAASDIDEDGFPTSAERLRGMSPVVADTMVEGGISRRRGAKLLMVAPSQFTLTETSSPSGIINATRTVLEGATAFLTIAPDPSNSLRFIGWYAGGMRIDSPLVLQPASLTITGNTSVEARYTDQATDSDTDGIPDWYELYHFGNLSQNESSDSDADGFSLLQEIARSQTPLLGDLIAEGGISRRRGTVVTFSPVTSVTCTLASDPPGLINEVITADSGSTIVTQNLWGSILSGLRFVGWELDGIRQTDPSGASAGSARFTAEEGVTATARFMSPTQDDDLDGIPDWYEWAYLGNIGSSETADPDGDGLDLTRESLLGLSPLQSDILIEGGISRRRSSGKTAVNLQPFERLRNVLVGGISNPWFTEDPAISPPSGVNFGNNISPALCDWDGDGDLDLFIASDGALEVYENTGSRFRMDFTDRTSKFGALSALCSTISHPRITSGDWNLDGKEDLILSDGQGSLHFIPSSHRFTGSNNGGASVISNPSATGMIPALGDLDGNGSPDLLLATPEGIIEFYPHTGNPAAPFSTSSSTGMAGAEIAGVTSLAITDFTLDGRNDVLAADLDGRIWEFHSQTDGSYFLSSKVWAGTGVGFAPTPTIAAGDLEGDGDIDLIGGGPDGALFALRDPKVGRPTGLTAAAGANSVLLEWNPDWQSRIKGYLIYRSTTEGAEKQRINSEIAEVPRYLDQDLQLAPEHFYHVTALTQAIYAGNSVPTLLESPPSATVSAMVRRVKLDLQDTSGFPGTLVRVLLSIENPVGLTGQGMDLRIQYPAGLIPLAQVPPGPRIPPGRQTVKASGLGNHITFTSNDTSANGELQILGSAGFLKPGQGKLFTLTFQIAPGTITGTDLTLTFASATLLDANAISIPLTLGAGLVHVKTRPNHENPPDDSIEVGNYGLGDINGDGWVNDDDLEFLKSFLHPSAEDPSTDEISAGDTNGDGKLTGRDLLGITRIISELEP